MTTKESARGTAGVQDSRGDVAGARLPRNAQDDAPVTFEVLGALVARFGEPLVSELLRELATAPPDLRDASHLVVHTAGNLEKFIRAKQQAASMRAEELLECRPTERGGRDGRR